MTTRALTSLRFISLIAVMVLTLTACGEPPVTPTPAPQAAIGVQVQCFVEGEVVFDQRFDRAETLPDGKLRVWLNNQSADLEADCRAVP